MSEHITLAREYADQAHERLAEMVTVMNFELDFDEEIDGTEMLFDVVKDLTKISLSLVACVRMLVAAQGG